MNWGCDVYLQPMWTDAPLPPDIAALYTRQLEPPFDLTINHWDPGSLQIGRESRAMTRLAVAWTMWEFMPSPLPHGLSGLVPHCAHRGTLRSRLKWYDAVLGYDQVSCASLAPYVPDGVALGQLQGGFDSSEWRPVERDWTGDRFGFAMHGALNQRKCPWTLIEAFRSLKDEEPGFDGATLSMHTMTPGLFPELNEILKDYKIRVWMEPWSPETLRAFYAAQHCLVYPSRGEGKNVPALEFLATGGTCAVTNFGGHTVWLRDDIAYPLDYVLTPTFPHRPDGAHDARVSVEHLKERLWHIYTHRAEAREKGELGSRLIPQMCDWAVVVERLWDKLADLVPGPGEVVRDLAHKARTEKLGDRDPHWSSGLASSRR
jgi:glycosyltransferase involved in cell wall biosynthesis